MPTTPEPDLSTASPAHALLVRIEGRVVAGIGRSLARGLTTAWSPWEAFTDHHRIDPAAPTDAGIVAYVEARAAVAPDRPSDEDPGWGLEVTSKIADLAWVVPHWTHRIALRSVSGEI